MRSAKSYFNTGLYVKNLKRYWPLWTAYLLIWVLMVPVPMLTSHNNYGWDTYMVSYDILNIATTAGPLLAFAFAILSAMALFSYLYAPASANMIASLPTRREGTFLSCFAAGLTWLLGANLVVTLLTLVVELGIGQVSLLYLLQFFAILSMQCLFFFGLAVLCAMLTGRLPVLPCLYVVLNFVVLVEYLVKNVMDGFIFGFYAGSGMALTPLCPLIQMTSQVQASSIPGAFVQGTADSGMAIAQASVSNLWMLAVYAAVGLVFAALALLLYRKRNMESAGDIIAIRVLRPVVRYAMYFGCALVLGMLLLVIIFPRSGSIWNLLACAVVGGLIGYFGSEMLMRMSFRVFRRSYRGFLVCTVLLCGLVAAVRFDLFGIESYTPKLAEVTSVEVRYNGSTVELDSPDSIAKVITMHRSIIANKDEMREQDSYYSSLRISYKLGNRTVMRAYGLNWDTLPASSVETIESALNCPEALLERVSFDYPLNERCSAYVDDNTGAESVYLTYAQLKTLYEDCILPDAQDGTIGFSDATPGAGEDLGLYIGIDFAYASDENGTDYIYKHVGIRPTEASARTNAYLASLGFPRTPQVPAG